jgi:hypothetical protein
MVCGTAAGRWCTFGVGGAQAAAEHSTPAPNINMMLVMVGIIHPPHPFSNSARPHDISAGGSLNLLTCSFGVGATDMPEPMHYQGCESTRIARSPTNSEVGLRIFSAV